MTKKDATKYTLNQKGQFVIEDYNRSKPFASFFPGIAGKTGIPMWVFYVNRGQGICSMGIESKDNPIMEFLPANWAYQLTSTQGFRTFLKLTQDGKSQYFEPFQDSYSDRDLVKTQRMLISPSHLSLKEKNKSLGLKISVEYHTVPEDNYAGVIRSLRISNTSKHTMDLEGLDGLPLIIPFGLNNFSLKHLRRLTEAFVEVTNLEQGAPLFKGKVEPADRPEVVHIVKGNFYLGMIHKDGGVDVVRPVVDPVKIFGPHADYAHPAAFLDHDFDQLTENQILENRLPSAMAPFKVTLAPGERFELTSIIGHIDSAEAMNAALPRLSSPDYLTAKMRRNRELVDSLTARNFIHSNEPLLDQYARQNFLDNVLRGGFPYTLKGQQDQTTLHLYSRRHGDLERDYNDYRITPSAYSQGNGAYRDINQNRRSDLFFNPDVGSRNLTHFYNLIQLDGFNPLVIKVLRFRLKDHDALKDPLSLYLPTEHIEPVLNFLTEARSPGEILGFIESLGMELNGMTDTFLGDVLSACERLHETDHGEGYWSDHWTYNLDLLHNFLAVFPEKEHDILFEENTFTFHDSAHVVKPRSEKYVLWDGRPMQLEAVTEDAEKQALLAKRVHDADLVHTEHGAGKVYTTTLVVKVLSLIANKLASLDPSGVGVEMESDKPNWYDALNGLPALIGSSLSETLELKRNLLYLQSVLAKPESPGKIHVYTELADFVAGLDQLMDDAPDSLEFWDRATSLKEQYRQRTRLGVSGLEKPLTATELGRFLDLALTKVNAGIDQAWDVEGQIPSTYFYHKVTAFEVLDTTDAKGRHLYQPTAFEIHHLPHFLEGPVHYLRTRPEAEQAAALVTQIRNSDLMDPELGMYKVNACLDEEPMEIGRARTFSPGWFENESIWLHMEYKYLLEILRNELYEDFFKDFKQVTVPFMDAPQYGRSILENSSFIVSSANPDPSLHGTGFVARLSGATAEFIEMLLLMAMGPKPFQLDEDGDLTCALKPALPEWLFTQEDASLTLAGYDEAFHLPQDSFSFMFLSRTLVTYHNPKRKATYGPQGVTPHEWRLTLKNGKVETFSGSQLPGEMAQKVRNRRVTRIDITLK